MSIESISWYRNEEELQRMTAIRLLTFYKKHRRFIWYKQDCTEWGCYNGPTCTTHLESAKRANEWLEYEVLIKQVLATKDHVVRIEKR